VFKSLLAASINSSTLSKIVAPAMDVCDAILPVLIGIVGAVGLIYCIVLGVRYAKAVDPQEHEKAKGGLKNAIIGFVLVFVLLIACKIGTSVFTNWWQNYNFENIIG